MSEYKYGFIGCGNMGGALVKAASKNINPNNIYVSDFDRNKVNSFANEIGIIPSNNKDIAQNADFIFLGVKPQMMNDMLLEIKDIFKSRKSRFVIVTMAAGLSIEKISAMADGNYPVIRIMPNTPASIGEGMILYAKNNNVTQEEADIFVNDMSSAGILDPIDEKLIDAASAVSGCGPAFVYMFIEALAGGAVECGLPRQKAMLYAAQTVLGSAELVLKSGKHPGELKDAVCSPGGTTIAGVHALENGAFRANAINAVVDAYKKTLELGKK